MTTVTYTFSPTNNTSHIFNAPGNDLYSFELTSFELTSFDYFGRPVNYTRSTYYRLDSELMY